MVPRAASPSGPHTDLPTTGTQIASKLSTSVPSQHPCLDRHRWCSFGGGARDIGAGDDPQLKISAICEVAFNNSPQLTAASFRRTR